MINKDDVSVKITHDVYLKLYHLRKPKLHKYQCIMVDEAQDCNPGIFLINLLGLILTVVLFIILNIINYMLIDFIK